MALTGNKGEWSEIYTLFKVLADGKIYSADGQLNRIEDLFFLINEVIRKENNDIEYHYTINHDSIRIIGDCVDFEIPRQTFSEAAQNLYHLIINSHASSSFPEIERFMNQIQCYSLKAKSQDKADIRMVVHDLRTSMDHKLGFSIKSKLGGKSTLFNSNRDSSNFIYQVTGVSTDDILSFNQKTRFSDKMSLLSACGGKLCFYSLANLTFSDNLLYIDSDMDKILAACLLQYYGHSGRTIADVVERVKIENPCHYPTSMDFYEHKIKQMLLSFALGMTSAKKWTGKYDANGGYIVVKEDGDVVCYHFYDRNDLEDYLYYNTGFETPSTTRHDFGYIYEQDGSYWLKLNLQIRFLH